MDLFDEIMENFEKTKVQRFKDHLAKEQAELRKIRFSKVKGYATLTDSQKELLDRVYVKHQSCMETEEKEKHQIKNITEVKWDETENCLKVYYDSGNWWHYDIKGEWY